MNDSTTKEFWVEADQALSRIIQRTIHENGRDHTVDPGLIAVAEFRQARGVCQRMIAQLEAEEKHDEQASVEAGPEARQLVEDRS